MAFLVVFHEYLRFFCSASNLFNYLSESNLDELSCSVLLSSAFCSQGLLLLGDYG